MLIQQMKEEGEDSESDEGVDKAKFVKAADMFSSKALTVAPLEAKHTDLDLKSAA